MKKVNVDKMLDDVGYTSEKEREEAIIKFEAKQKEQQLKKDKIKSMTFCRRTDKW